MNRSCRLLSLLGLLVPSAVWATAPSPPDVWSTGAYETVPLATDAVGEGDDQIRALKTEIRSRMDPEHQFGTANTGQDNGLHRIGSARCFVQSAAPTAIEVAAYGSDGDAGVSTLSADETNATTCTNCDANQKTGHGRCWLDTDDYQFYVYDDTNGWIRTGFTLGPNLVFNGDFEMDGSASTSIPTGWAQIGADNTFAFAATAETEGEGLKVTVTDDSDAAALEGIKQTLTGLRASTSYVYVARVNATAGDSCRITTTGASTNVSATSATTAAWETVSGTFTTDATPTNVVINLIGVADTDVCDWDHVGVMEIGGNVPIPIAKDFVNQTTADLSGGATYSATEYSGADATLIQGPAFIAPVDGCYLTLSANYGGYQKSSGGSNFQWAAAVQVDTDGDTYATTVSRSDMTILTTTIEPMTVALYGVMYPLTAGSVYTTRLQYIHIANGAGSSRAIYTQNTGYLNTELHCPGN
jgi:Carbohydrate binding domain